MMSESKHFVSKVGVTMSESRHTGNTTDTSKPVIVDLTDY